MSQRLLFPWILIGVIAGATGAQEPAAEFEGTVEVTEVLLDVLTTDRSGEAVTGLGKEDFIVTENGEPVDLTGVSYYTTRYGADGSLQTADGEVPSSRYFIFFFHDLRRYLVASQRFKVGRASREWVEDGMLPSDWVAVASYDYKLKVHLDFTQDREQILQAILGGARGEDPEKDAGRRGRPVPPAGAPSLLRNLPQGDKLRQETRRIYDGIRLLADASALIVGRKNLLMFTPGFGELRRGSPFPTGDPRRYPPMEQALNDANVAVYGIDLTPDQIGDPQRHFMTRLANDTGGEYYGTFVDFLTPLEQIAAENVGYYMLSYQSEHPASEVGYQEVTVRARDKSVKVRARKGYLYGTAGG